MLHKMNSVQYLYLCVTVLTMNILTSAANINNIISTSVLQV